jgi:hypothetical protein
MGKNCYAMRTFRNVYPYTVARDNCLDGVRVYVRRNDQKSISLTLFRQYLETHNAHRVSHKSASQSAVVNEEMKSAF